MITKNSFCVTATQGSTLLLFAFLLLFSDCKKQSPSEIITTSEFTTDQTEYLAGDTVFLTNTSVGAVSNRWIFFNGQVNSKTNAQFILGPNMENQTINFVLETFNENSETFRSEKTISVIAAGQKTFRSSSSGYPKDIYINDVKVGSLLKMYNSSIGCDPLSCFITLVKTGKHQIKSVCNGTVIGAGEITIYNGEKDYYMF